VYDADKAVRGIYTQPESIADVRERFGSGVLDAKGNVDRKALAAIVFADPAKLELLTSQVIFPRTGKAITDAIEHFKQSTAPALLLDAPTLFESGRNDVCEKIVFVAAPLERRKAWAAERGWDEGEVERRESRMYPEQAKRAKADAVIENTGTIADVERQVQEILKLWGVGQ